MEKPWDMRRITQLHSRRTACIGNVPGVRKGLRRKGQPVGKQLERQKLLRIFAPKIHGVKEKGMKESVRLVRFVVVGTLNYLITMSVIGIIMAHSSFKGDYIVANITAYLIAQTHNFIWSKYWIFPSAGQKNSLWQQIALFCTAFGIAYLIQILFVILMVEGIGVDEILAQFIGIVIYGAVNFVANKKITFR